MVAREYLFTKNIAHLEIFADNSSPDCTHRETIEPSPCQMVSLEMASEIIQGGFVCNCDTFNSTTNWITAHEDTEIDNSLCAECASYYIEEYIAKQEKVWAELRRRFGSKTNSSAVRFCYSVYFTHCSLHLVPSRRMHQCPRTTQSSFRHHYCQVSCTVCRVIGESCQLTVAQIYLISAMAILPLPFSVSPSIWHIVPLKQFIQDIKFRCGLVLLLYFILQLVHRVHASCVPVLVTIEYQYSLDKSSNCGFSRVTNIGVSAILVV